jgi:hypothetical protein
MAGTVDICFVHFRSLNLIHLDAAWYSLSRQGFQGVKSVQFLDNNTDDSPEAIQEVLNRYPIPVPVNVEFSKHGDPSRTQSWSVNHVCRDMAEGPDIFFTRSDYILSFDCLQRFRHFIADQPATQKIFASGWCWQMAYDREAKNIDANIDIEQYNWRHLGMEALLQHPYAFRFHETHLDAGVWMTRKKYLEEAGWMNEKLVSWGYQQSTFQRFLERNNVRCLAIQDYLFAHQHHYAVRNFDLASAEYSQHGGGY